MRKSLWPDRAGAVIVFALCLGTGLFGNRGVAAPASTGGYFMVSGTTNDHLEADIATTRTVAVPLARLETGIATNLLVAAFPGRATISNLVVWSAAETAQVVTVAVPAGLSLAPGSARAPLVLRDAAGSDVAESAIWLVDAPAVDVLNPLWIGERNAATLKAGEWTMDLDVATNRAAVQSGAAYTLVEFAGVLWCPWCAGLEADVLNSSAFAAWCTNRNVSLVVCDNAKRNDAAPSLLRMDAGSGRLFSDRETRVTVSGAAYLSRKMISGADAAAVLARNHVLGYETWNLPGHARIGYPTLVLLRKDGTIIGRVSIADNGDFTFKAADVLQRLDELITLASDPTEESNGDLATTTLEIGANGTDATQSLQASDLVDVWRLANVATNVRARITLSGIVPADVTCTLLQVADGRTNTLATAAGDLAALTNVVVQADITATGACYIVVTGNGATTFTPTNTASTIRNYTLAVSCSKIPDPAAIGRLQFGYARPAYARNWTVYANAKTSVLFAIRRIGGSASNVSATVSATGGTLSTNFLAWADQDADPIRTFTLNLPAYDATSPLITLELAASNTTVVTGCDRVYVRVVPADAPEFAADTLAGSAVQYVAYSNSVRLVGLQGGTVKLRNLGGTLPAGLTVAYDAGAEALVVSGTPTARGDYLSVWQPVEMRSGGAAPGIPVSIKITVDRNTVLAKATTYFTGFATDTSAGPGATNRVTGAIALTISQTGANTLTYRNFAGTFQLKSAGWDSLTAGGALSATCVSGKYYATISIDGDGFVTGTIFDAYFGHEASIECAAKDWSSAKPASAYRGYYTIDLEPEALYSGKDAAACFGHGYLGISMNDIRANSGTYTVFGRFPDGTAFSGSSVLLPGASADVGILPISIHTSVDVLTGILAVRKDGAKLYKTNPCLISDAVPFFWKHTSTASAKATYQLRFSAHGGYYSTTRDLIACGSNTFQKATSVLLATDPGRLPDSAAHGQVTGLASGIGLIIDGSSISRNPQDATEGVTFGFNHTSGIYWGVIPVRFADGRTVTANFKGILIPGWGADCDCRPASEEARPFGVGACWYSDTCTISGTTIPVKHGTTANLE